MKKNGESKLWVTVAKLVIGAVLLIGGVGGALWLASKWEQGDASTTGSSIGWGISTDSPIPSKR
jgi:hypothetical protein